MYILNANFYLLKQIGDISQEKLNELKSAFRDYPEITAESGQSLVFKKGISAIVIQGNQLTYVTQGEPSEVNLQHIIQELTKLNEILNLPHESPIGLRMEAIKDYDINVMDKSLEISNINSKPLGADGIGYRFIINNEKFHGDVYIEPFLKDKQRAFFNVILNSSTHINVNNANDFLNDLFNFAVESVKEVADDLYKE